MLILTASCVSLTCNYVNWFHYIVRDVVLLFQGQWILQEGGANPRDLVYRCLNRLIASEMQLRVNRTGAKNTNTFPPALEAVLKGKC